MEAGCSMPGRTMRVLRTISTDSPPRTLRTQRIKPDCLSLRVLGVLCGGSSLRSAPCRSLEECPSPCPSDKLSVLDDEPSAREHRVGGAGHLPSLARVVIDLHVQRPCGDLDLPVRIH